MRSHPLKEKTMKKYLVTKMADFYGSLQLAHAARKGQKINTITHLDGTRSYEIIIN
jgi:hypothetical protein